MQLQGNMLGIKYIWQNLLQMCKKEIVIFVLVVIINKENLRFLLKTNIVFLKTGSI